MLQGEAEARAHHPAAATAVGTVPTPAPATASHAMMNASCKTSDDSSEAAEHAYDTLSHHSLTVPSKRKRRWTDTESKALKQAVGVHGLDAWTEVAADVGTRTPKQCIEHYQNVIGYALYIHFASKQCSAFLW